ncbi:hypothetical protein E4U39_005355 [Claviceps sp. Clav50 group G5]|nr:hypothetical protein E4U39_005355 [Claviceps sp. Clav50 group G5]
MHRELADSWESQESIDPYACCRDPPTAYSHPHCTVTAEHLDQCDTFPAAKGTASQLHGMALFMANAAAFIEHSLTFEKISKAMLQGGFAEMRTEFRVTDLNSSRRMQNSIVVEVWCKSR